MHAHAKAPIQYDDENGEKFTYTNISLQHVMWRGVVCVFFAHLRHAGVFMSACKPRYKVNIPGRCAHVVCAHH